MPPSILYRYANVGLVLALGCTPGSDAAGDATTDNPTGSTSAVTGTTSPDGGDATGNGTTGNAPADTAVDTQADGTTAGQTSDTPTDDTAGQVVCDGARVCVAETPAGWNGPVALRAIDPAGAVPDCAGDYPQLMFENGYAGLVAPPNDCSCACTLGAVACGGTARVRLSNAQQVSGQSPCAPATGGASGLLNVTVTAGIPQNYDPGEIDWAFGDLHGVTVDQVAVAPQGACTEQVSASTTPAAWSERTIACGTTDLGGGCDAGQACVPRPVPPYDEDVCIWHEGELPCPAAYPVLSLVHQDYDDQRECTTCSCGDAAGTCSGAEVLMTGWDGGALLGGDANIAAPNSYCEGVEGCEFSCCSSPPNFFCFIPPVGPWAVDSVAEIALDPGTLALTNPAAPCPPQGGNAAGQATPTDPVTVCCAGL